MKTYALTTRIDKMDLVKTIIKTEDLDAIAKLTEDVYGNLWIEITADEEDYAILKDVYNMVKGY